MKKIVVSGVLSTLMVLGGAQVASAQEATTTSATPKTQAEMLAQIQSLMKLIADLQAKLAQVKGEVEELTKDLAVGAKDDDVLKIQEILASDPTLFGVKPTGYFGPMTEEALKKFQERYGLEVTGKLDEATRAVMKELRKERKNGMVPPGLIKSDEVKERIKMRLLEKWDKKHDDDMDDEDELEDEDESDDDSAAATREEARVALADTQAEVAAYRADVVAMTDKEEKKDGLETLREAQKKMVEARKKFARMKFDDVMEITDEVSSLLDGSDDSSDDEDEDEDNSDEDDEDDEEESDDDSEDEDEDEEEDD